MPVTADATALIALAKVRRFDVLQCLAVDIYISPWVKQAELRAYAGQVDAAIEAGWLHVVTPSRTLVGELIKFSGLDQGEAESIVVASQLDHPGMRLLLDEGRAFAWIQRNPRRPPRFHVVCLGPLLHDAEDAGCIDSAEVLMRELLDSGAYRWAPSVWQHDEAWCQARSIPPLPRNPGS